MKLLFLHSGDRVPSARFRVLPLVLRIRAAGHYCTVAASFPQKYDYFRWLGFRPSQLLKRLVRFWHLACAWWRRYDVIIIERELFDDPSTSMEDRFRRIAPVLILDVDDAIFLRFPEKFEHLARIADQLVVGNRFLADYCRPINEHFSIIPTCIELNDYPQKSYSPLSNGPAVIGWMGTTGNLRYLNVVAPALRSLARRFSFELRLVAGESHPLREIDLSGVNVRFVPWNGHTEVDELLQFDVGLMPLPTSEEWTRYKCGLKLLQYMAVGIPGVASPVGVNAHIIEDGVNGFLAETTDHWEAALAKLIEHSQLRRDMGQRARETVRQDYSVERYVPRWLETVEAAVRRVRGELT